MEEQIYSSSDGRSIMRFVETQCNGIRSLVLSRYAIGYVLHGRKLIYCGDKCRSVACGDLFYLGIGHHYIENLADERHPFEQIVFYYSPEWLQRIMRHLTVTYGLTVTNKHSCDQCRAQNVIVMPCWGALRGFFGSTDAYLREEGPVRDEAAENIKLTELVYHIASHGDCCLKSRMLGNLDSSRESFEHTVYEYVFRDCPIEELARSTHRSITSFKKEFQRLFFMPPHRWFVRQRLTHARLLLISTTMSVSEIGAACMFANTSHFIKLFKREYGLTPAMYRSSYRQIPPPREIGQSLNNSIIINMLRRFILGFVLPCGVKAFGRVWKPHVLCRVGENGSERRSSAATR